jgi:hypothetical protein
MSRPGDRLRALAVRWCQPRAMERLIDPVIADLQREYADAMAQCGPWRGRWVRLAGTVAFWKVLGSHAAGRMPHALAMAASRNARAIGRVVAFSAAAALVITLVLMLPPLQTAGRRAGDYAGALYLVPQALPIGIAIGLPFGILLGLRGRSVTSALRGLIAAIVCVGALVSSLTVIWALPDANQAFRERTFGGRLPKGANELTLRELSARIDALNRAGASDRAPTLARALHMRGVVSSAPLFLGLFAIGVCSVARSAARSITIGLAATIGYAAFYSFVSPARFWSGVGLLSPPVVAWTPNVLLALATVAMLTRVSFVRASSADSLG